MISTRKSRFDAGEEARVTIPDIPLPELHGLDKWLLDGWVNVDEEMDLADRAVLASQTEEDALQRLRVAHREAFEQAIRDKDEERLSGVVRWMERDALCIQELAKIRRLMGWKPIRPLAADIRP